MRTCGALAIRFPSSRKLAHDGLRCPLSHLLEPPRRRAPAPAPTLAPDPRLIVFVLTSRFPPAPMAETLVAIPRVSDL
eukprot:2964601-Pleurochrysis_carterae.AAC.4